ncbi:uncharacterized protein DS421_17g580790 [Arachis hypogaea]|nr:uncharacterized protein DS421_17g580790 [Arachis hypogaea]
MCAFCISLCSAEFCSTPPCSSAPLCSSPRIEFCFAPPCSSARAKLSSADFCPPPPEGEKRDCTGIQFKPPGCWVPLPWLKGLWLQEKNAFWIQNFGMHVLVPLFLYQLLEAELCTFHKVTVNRSMQIAEALQMQMEVQRHLQLKIEAQGKYLQSILHKAQETLAGMINNGSPGSPPISELTETRGGFSGSCGQRKQNRGAMYSLEI